MGAKRITNEEMSVIRRMMSEGATQTDIADEIGRCVSAVSRAVGKIKADGSQRRTTLDSFTPRELIKHLYELGYRIEDNQLVLIERKVVNLKSVVGE